MRCSVCHIDIFIMLLVCFMCRSPWAQLQDSYANATGHAPVYPQWASGYWQCKNRYHNQTQVMDIARGHTQRGYPISLLIIDYFRYLLQRNTCRRLIYLSIDFSLLINIPAEQYSIQLGTRTSR